MKWTTHLIHSSNQMSILQHSSMHSTVGKLLPHYPRYSFISYPGMRFLLFSQIRTQKHINRMAKQIQFWVLFQGEENKDKHWCKSFSIFFFWERFMVQSILEFSSHFIWHQSWVSLTTLFWNRIEIGWDWRYAKV